MSQGLSVSRLVSVSVVLAPIAPALRSFGALLIVGDSSVIGPTERLRPYTGIEAIATDFGTSAPEYLAAQLYFGQSPKPEQLFIGRWFQAATSAFVKGGILSTAQQVLSLWTVVTAGAFKITIDGTEHDLSGL